MPKSATSSSEDGGAPLYSPAKPGTSADANDQQRKSSSGGSTADEGAALAQANRQDSSQNLGGETPSSRSLKQVQSDGHQSSTSQTRTAFVQRVRNPSENYDGSPMSYRTQQQAVHSASNLRPAPQAEGHMNAFQAIQHEILSGLHLVRVAPNIGQEQADALYRMLTTIGQKLTDFAKFISDDRTELLYSAGELRVQLQGATKELAERKKQVEDLKSRFSLGAQLNEDLARKIAILQDQLGAAKSELHRQKSGFDRMNEFQSSQDGRYTRQIDALERNIQQLRMGLEDSTRPSTAFRTSQAEESRIAYNEGMVGSMLSDARPRGASNLDPTAPAYGPRSVSSSRDSNSGNIPMVLHMDRGSRAALEQSVAASQSFDRPLTPSYGRSAYGTQETFHKRPAVDPRPGTRLGFHHGRAGSGQALHGGSEMVRYAAPPPAFGPSQRDSLRQQMPTAAMTSGGRASSDDAATGMPHDNYNGLNETSYDDIQVSFERLYGLVEGTVATQYVDAPFNEANALLPVSHETTWEYLLTMGLANKHQSAAHIAHLLQASQVRQHVLKRAITTYIFQRVIHPEVFVGYTDHFDGHLRALQERMKSRHAPHVNARAALLERQRVLEDHAKVIMAITSSDDAEARNFRSKLVEDHTDALLKILYPLRSVTVADGLGREAMYVVMKNAFALSTKIWTSGFSIHFFFPETGCKFSNATMHAMNHIHIPGEQMQFAQMRVMLVVTPSLSLRDERNADMLRTRDLMKSDVLVMK